MIYTIPGFLSYFLFSFVGIKYPSSINLFWTNIPVILLLFSLSFILGQQYDLGVSFSYGQSELYLGGFTFNRLYSVSIAVMLVPFFYRTFKKSKIKYLLVGLIAIALIGLMISMRRTSFVSIIIFYFIFISLSASLKFKFKYLAVIVLVGSLGYFSYDLYSEKLIERIAAREKSIEEGIENEGRVIEFYGVSEIIFSFDEPFTSLFGKEMFNTAGHYRINNTIVDRKIHNNFNLYLFNTGLIGFLLFIAHLIVFLKTAFVLRKHCRYHFAFYVAYFVSFIFFNFSGTYGNLALISFQYGIFGLFHAISNNYRLGVDYEKLQKIQK
jgi:hypothetical protein